MLNISAGWRGILSGKRGFEAGRISGEKKKRGLKELAQAAKNTKSESGGDAGPNVA